MKLYHILSAFRSQIGPKSELFEIGPHWGKRHVDEMGRAGAFGQFIWLVRTRGSRFGRCTGHARVFLLRFLRGLAGGGSAGFGRILGTKTKQLPAKKSKTQLV